MVYFISVEIGDAHGWLRNEKKNSSIGGMKVNSDFIDIRRTETDRDTGERQMFSSHHDL